MTASAIASRLTIEPATPQDDAELRAMLREMPMGRRIEVAFLREPSFLEAASILGTDVQIFVGLVDGRVAGVGTRAIRPSFINGERVDAGYLADLRIRPEYRGGTFLVRAYRFLREAHHDGRVNVYSTVIVEDNRQALATIAANRAGLPRYTPLGRILTPAIHLRRRLPQIPANIIGGSIERLPEIVEVLNENRLQFAPAYSEEDFVDGRLRGFRPEDFRVLMRDGRAVGVMGVWDQCAFRQTVIVRYRGLLAALRPLINMVRRPPLPPPGQAFRCFHVAMVSTRTVEDFRALLRHVYNDAIGRGYGHFTLGLHERDPRTAALNSYAITRFGGRLFAVTFDQPPRLDDRVPYVEAAFL